MGVYLNCFWQPDSGGMNKAERMGGPYHPYLPDALADYELLLSPSCASAVADAQEALARLELSGSRIDTEPLARMMLRAEAVSSSRIEGLEMPAGKLLEYEELDRLGVDHRLDGTEAQILGNLHTLVDGLARAEAGSPLTVEEVCELNRVLLAGTRLAERGGVIRARTELDRRQSRQPGSAPPTCLPLPMPCQLLWKISSPSPTAASFLPLPSPPLPTLSLRPSIRSRTATGAWAGRSFTLF